MGDKNGHAAATKYVEHIQKTLKYEKTQVNERKGRKGATYSSHTISRATGFNTSPRKRPKMTRNKMGTWSHTQGRLVQANLKKHENLTSTLVLENSHAHGRSSSLEFLTLASQPDRVYRYQGISQRLFEQETSLSDPRPEGQAAPFHIQEAALERRDSNDPLPRLPDEDDQRERDSLTDYESMDEQSRSKEHNMLSSQRHVRELRKVEHDFMQPVAELGLEGTDREWEQWLQLKDDE